MLILLNMICSYAWIIRYAAIMIYGNLIVRY
jgi:hypothetical protein